VKKATQKKRDGKRIFFIIVLGIVVAAFLMRRFFQLIH